MDLPWSKLDATTFSWQKVLGGEAQHGVIVLSPNVLNRLETFKADRPIPKIFQLLSNSSVNKKLFLGNTINTPSMLCIEDVLDSLMWVQKIGGLKKTIELIFRVCKHTSDKTFWFNFFLCLAIKIEPSAPKDADSVGVAIPNKIEPKTVIIKSVGGIIVVRISLRLFLFIIFFLGRLLGNKTE